MTVKLKLALFVHDFQMEVGHSRAMIEQLRNMPKDGVGEIKIYAYNCGDINRLLPDLKNIVKVYRPPIHDFYPFLLKEMFFHLWSAYRISRDDLMGFVKISIGTACLQADVVNVQFIQSQWEPLFFKYQKMNLLVWPYKKIMYSYFRWCEKLIFNRPKVLVYALSGYIEGYLKGKFSIEESRLKLIYSGVNFEEFKLTGKRAETVFEGLTKNYPELLKIDINQPICLFVGAYERKGLQTVIDKLDKLSSYQLIVVGQGDATHSIVFSKNPLHKVIKIHFTRQIADFYMISDTFFFPTIYEPFGLVILEAAVMGLQIITRKEMVGASELLGDLKEIYFIDDKNGFTLPALKKLSFEQKILLRDERMKRFSQYSWQKSAWKLYEFIVTFNKTSE